MKLFIPLLLFTFGVQLTFGQLNLIAIDSPNDLENIKVEKLASDSLGSSFLIWIPEQVKAHFHAIHSEHVYIIEGKGTMWLDEQSFEIKPGAYFFIPKNTIHSVLVEHGPMRALSIQTPEFVGKDRIFPDYIKRPD